ncbi:Asx homology domain-containing protein [Podospora didyma]|uniref:Asx homology domain-containing protein n=1 Tax=Podospora didyma TaxID=330526 RepID=A0AAE0NCB7_9PEZI|nr:Asx homology domain-containing protein [Podospora didyma]
MSGGSSPLSSPPKSDDDTTFVDNMDKASQKAHQVPSIMEQLIEMETAQKGAIGKPVKGNADDPAEGDENGDLDMSSVPKRNAPRTRSQATQAKKQPPRPPAAQKKTAKDKKWEAPFVYTDPKSPLAQADLRAILLMPEAWDVLDADEKRAILAKFPDDTHILDPGTEHARPNLESLRNDDNFRNDCARYCENLEKGRHDEEWLHQAWVAHEKHKRGDFDDYLRQKFEEDWNMELPEDQLPSHNLRRGGDLAANDSEDSAQPKVPLASEALGDATTNSNGISVCGETKDASLTASDHSNDENGECKEDRTILDSDDTIGDDYKSRGAVSHASTSPHILDLRLSSPEKFVDQQNGIILDPAAP